jgi:7,8-dihydroneopterin 2',3'-cyclic phosphate phosphodiesterase
MKRAPIFEYARVYYSSGRDGLREYIKKLLGLTPQ